MFCSFNIPTGGQSDTVIFIVVIPSPVIAQYIEHPVIQKSPGNNVMRVPVPATPGPGGSSNSSAQLRSGSLPYWISLNTIRQNLEKE